ncbi:hypothetical protein COTS27_00130 [Spirochaetota bacterium]|nr:hypothetical protein COTS27_00130 [Spirochaetota bacterium]
MRKPAEKRKRKPLEFKSLLEFIQKNDKFIIPVYQRNYDWDENQCRELFNDLKYISKNKLKDYLLGTIYSFYKEGGKERIVIDGQQRLTTIFLLLLAMRNSVSSGKRKATKFTKQGINNKYLINETRYTKKKEKIKLKQTKKDANIFDSLINDSVNKESSKSKMHSNIYKNYKFFIDELNKENLKKENLDLDKIYNSMEELMIVDFLLQKDDDPQLIFQNLNATGLALAEADKIRNFILMNEDGKKQEEYHNKYWKQIEENVTFKTTEFIRDFLTHKTRSIPNIKEVYFNFKNFYSNKDTDKKGFLTELLQFSTYYRFILQPVKFPDKKISELLKEIQTLKVAVFNPALLALLADYDSNKIDNIQLKKILETVISYVVRRSICDIPTSNDIFSSLIFDVKKKKNYEQQYAEILKHNLMKKGSIRRFPKDDEVEKALLTKNVFRMKNKLYFLTKLENHKNKEPVDIEQLISGEVQIEHIMPQRIKNAPKWQKDLGKNWEPIHSEYLHTLGNLTLIISKSNIEISNNPFKYKKQWFKKSRFYLNKYLTRIEKFTEKELNQRTKHLTKRVLEIWKYPQIQETEQNDFYTLEDVERTDFTGKKTIFAGKKIISLSICDDNKAKIDSWKDFYVKTIKFLLESDPRYLEKIKALPSIKIGSKDQAGRTPRKVIDEIYVNVRPTSVSILKDLTKIVDETDFDKGKFRFWVEDD